MVKKRERLEIIRDILIIVNKKREIGPTRLLHLSNLSPQMFKEYVVSLEEKGFIRKEILKNKKKFTITGKGLQFLEDYRVIEKFVDSFGL